MLSVFFFFQAEDGIRDLTVTGVQTCALPIYAAGVGRVDRDGVVRLRAEQDGLLDLGRRLVVLHRLQGHGDRGGLPHPVTVTLQTVQNDQTPDRKSTRLNSSHRQISYSVFCLENNYC